MVGKKISDKVNDLTAMSKGEGFLENANELYLFSHPVTTKIMLHGF